ncbi:MAG TPA: GYD domain-containing protein [Acidimicrobiales bacterium]|nr:GYD domain-containing protein [Acidimicrobiales bacterium]
MAKYLLKASYSTEGIKGVLKEGGSGRAAAVDQLIKSVGGKVEAFYFAFGDNDVYIIADLPDNASAAAVAAAVTSAGALSSYETTVLLTPAEIDEAVKKAVSYRPPGG